MEERKAEHFLEGKTQQVPGERKAETYDDKLYKAISILNEKPGSFSSVFTGFFLAIFNSILINVMQAVATPKRAMSNLWPVGRMRSSRKF